jgi:hypothetical protein
MSDNNRSKDGKRAKPLFLLGFLRKDVFKEKQKNIEKVNVVISEWVYVHPRIVRRL